MLSWLRRRAPAAEPLDGVAFWGARSAVQRAGGVHGASVTERQMLLLTLHQEACEVLKG